jgi:hypothetical protein
MVTMTAQPSSIHMPDRMLHHGTSLDGEAAYHSPLDFRDTRRDLASGLMLPVSLNHFEERPTYNLGSGR